MDRLQGGLLSVVLLQSSLYREDRLLLTATPLHRGPAFTGVPSHSNGDTFRAFISSQAAKSEQILVLQSAGIPLPQQKASP